MITFNNIKIPSFVKVQKIDVQTLPTIETNLKSIVGSSGRLAGRTTLGEKTISCDVIIVIPADYTLQKCSRELAVWLRGDNFKLSPLIISDDKDIRYWAKVSNSAEISDLLVAGQGTIEFVVPSGDSEAVRESTVTATDRIRVSNNGTKTVYPVMKLVVGTAVTNNNILVQNTTTGESLSLYGNVQTGDTITIDCNKNLVKKNNEVAMNMLSLTSEFFGLQLGANEITCNNAGTKISVTYHEKYL